MNSDISEKQGNIALPHQRLLLICCLVSFGCYSGAYMRIPVLPLFARGLGADTLQVGMITSSFMLVAGLLCFPLGIISDRLGRKRLILAGLLLSSATSFLLGFSKTPWQLLGVYLFSGAGIAAFAPTMMSFVIDFSPKTHIGRSYGWYTMSLYGGMSVGPALGGFAAQVLSFEWVFTISALFTFIMFWIALMALPGHPGQHHQSRPERKNTAIFRELARNRFLLACLLVTLGSSFCLGVFITFAPLHASDQGIGVGEIGIIFGVQAVVNALCRIPFGYLSDQVADRKKMVFAGLLGYSLSIVGIGVSSSLSSFLVSAFAMGICMGIAFTAIGALIAEVVPSDSRGFAMGAYNTCIYLGMMLSALIMGMITRDLGFRFGFITTALINAVCALAFLLLFRFASGRKCAFPGR